MKRLFICIIFCICFFITSQTVFASSSYVLPYPSTMPGNFTYKIHLVWEKVMQYWYFGNFGQFDYNLKESDKYLVEAKTLFEYNQYLLGYSALQKSNQYFTNTLPNLLKAQQTGEDISQKRQLLHEAALKHIEVLQKMLTETPATFTWTPEKTSASNLDIHALINQGITIRQKYF